ncbi:pyridoxal phosphate-dependent aminotransferase [Streptomyces sp. NPDC052396]|uniref:pyridoxal phosphate-dependent aminotransferase n=1 Tax=Streptomyces sp. NPDC052396 TaxID=3365689 RepID=UPI0037D7C587
MSVRGSRAVVEQLVPEPSPARSRMPSRSPVWDHLRMTDATPPFPAVQPPTDRRVSARIGSISESATLAVDAKAKALKAAGRPVIGFGAGEPDFPTPGYIVEAAVEACRDPKYHRYTPAGGLPELKAAIAAKTLRDSGYQVDASQVLVTNGGKQAIYEAFAAILDPGDEVIVPAPYWTTYPESIRLAGGIPVEVTADETTGYRVSVEQLEAARTAHTKVLLFVSPSNPTGAVYSREQIEEIGRWAAEHGLWVLTDEIYEHLVYGDAEFHSLPVLVPELRNKCIVVNGVAKTYAMTGWRVGWIIGPQDVVKAATNLQSHATSNVSNVAQAAALAAVSGDLKAVEEMKTAFDRRRRTIVRMLNEIDGVICPEPEGAFYAYPSVKGLLGKDFRGKRPATSVELAALILEEAEVAVVPGEAFGTPGYLRLSYALGDEDLVEGVSRIQKLLAEAQD